MDDSICKEGDIPHPDFSPKAIGMAHADDRPITMSVIGLVHFLLQFLNFLHDCECNCLQMIFNINLSCLCSVDCLEDKSDSVVTVSEYETET